MKTRTLPLRELWTHRTDGFYSRPARPPAAYVTLCAAVPRTVPPRVPLQPLQISCLSFVRLVWEGARKARVCELRTGFAAFDEPEVPER